MSAELLDQDEIDALVNGLQEGTVDVAPRPAEDTGEARAYDFTAGSRVVRGRLPALELVNERMARALRMSLFDMLRRSPDVSVLGVSTLSYAEYVASLAVPTSLNLIRFQPLSGTGLMIFDAKLVFAVIDVFFGGNGRYAKIEGRDFTATENHIINLMMERAFAAVHESWGAILPVKIEFISREVNPNFANVVGPSDVVVVSRLRVEFEGRGGEVHLALPYSMLEPLKDKLRSGVQTDRGDREERWSQLLRNELEETEVELVTRLGTATTTVGRLIDMRPGDVIPIEFDGQVTVLSDGIPLFRGELGQQRGRQVVRVCQMSTRKTGNALDAFVRKSA